MLLILVLVYRIVVAQGSLTVGTDEPHNAFFWFLNFVIMLCFHEKCLVVYILQLIALATLCANFTSKILIDSSEMRDN